MSEQSPALACAETGCQQSYPYHKWGSIKAHEQGWFQQRDGTSWCPEHVPEWVALWRYRG